MRTEIESAQIEPDDGPADGPGDRVVAAPRHGLEKLEPAVAVSTTARIVSDKATYPAAAGRER